MRVEDARLGHKHGAPAAPARPPGKVHVFQVGKKVFVKHAHILEEGAPVKGGTGRGAEDGDRARGGDRLAAATVAVPTEAAAVHADAGRVDDLRLVRKE